VHICADLRVTSSMYFRVVKNKRCIVLHACAIVIASSTNVLILFHVNIHRCSRTNVFDNQFLEESSSQARIPPSQAPLPPLPASGDVHQATPGDPPADMMAEIRNFRVLSSHSHSMHKTKQHTNN